MNNPIQLAIVDDHELIRNTWKMVLQRDKRIEVIAECASGAEAIECAGKIAPDMMLMDINMSPVNGFEATRKITELYPSIKIIGTSINNQTAYVRMMMQAGAKGYVTKNSSSAEMVEAIIAISNGGTYICKEITDKLQGNELT